MSHVFWKNFVDEITHEHVAFRQALLYVMFLRYKQFLKIRLILADAKADGAERKRAINSQIGESRSAQSPLHSLFDWWSIIDDLWREIVSKILLELEKAERSEAKFENRDFLIGKKRISRHYLIFISLKILFFGFLKFDSAYFAFTKFDKLNVAECVSDIIGN